MAGNPYLWSTTAATNSSADSDINWAEGQLPSTVNDSARGVMAGVAGWLKDTNSTLTTAGTANVQTVTTNVAYVALATGIRLHFKAGVSNSAACTLNVTPAGGAAFGPKAIKIISNSAEIDPVANNIRVNGHYVIEYDAAANSAAGAWILLNPTLVPAVPVTAGLVFISTQVASTSATIDFTGIDGTYDEYLVYGSNIHCAVDNVDFWMRLSEDNGSTFKAGASDYAWGFGAILDSAIFSPVASAADTKIRIASSQSTIASRSMSFAVRISSPSSATISKLITSDVTFISSNVAGPNMIRTFGFGEYIGTTNAVNAVRFLTSSGNISSGNFRLYGVRSV